MGLVEKRGAFYSYQGERLGQGRENAKLFLSENPHILAELEGQIREMAGLAPVSHPHTPEDEVTA
jgi:recombination protein RecA